MSTTATTTRAMTTTATTATHRACAVSRARGASMGGRRAMRAPRAEPEWKVKQREQDAAISAEEDAVRGRVREVLESINASSSSSSGAASGAATMGAGAGAGAAGDARSALMDKVKRATASLEYGLVERETEVRLLLLAACCGEHLLLLGPPGTAKSELGRRLSALCDGGLFFERLLTRFSVPEELFGPLSMRGLENDQYVRQIDGYLPTANVAFVDEIFKANSAILNSLLTILNERLFDNGSERINVPLLCLVGASNELPESEELDALYDRFLLRSSVEQVSAAGLGKLLALKGETAIGARAGGAGEATVVLRPEDFSNIRYEAAENTTVPSNVIELISDLRTFLQEKCEPPVYVSDRRLLKAVQLLRVAAYTNGRDEVSEFDTLLLTNVLWQRPSESVMIKDWILERLAQDRGTKQVQYLLAGLFGRACRADGDTDECKQLLKEASSLRQVLTSQLNSLRGAQGGSLPALREHLWLSPADASRAAQTLGPMFSKVRTNLEDLLEETLTLEVALERNTEPHILALLMPNYWADFIRSGPIEDVAPLGQASP
jgi:MoxR-like ATPase